MFVFSGHVFCGVVGHDYRHEYTVIGKMVNMAARLMCHYPGRSFFGPTKVKIQKLNETQSKFDLDYFDYLNVGGYEQRERIANSLAQ